MAAEIIAGLGVFKSMLDVAKGLKDMNDATVRNTAIIELQGNILSAQAEQMALVERVSQLEKEMTRFETWEAQKQRYRLTQCARGAFAYVLKESEANGEPGHALCTNCYENGTKSILQTNGKLHFLEHAWGCPSCKAEVRTEGDDLPEFAN